MCSLSVTLLVGRLRQGVCVCVCVYSLSVTLLVSRLCQGVCVCVCSLSVTLLVSRLRREFVCVLSFSVRLGGVYIHSTP